MRDAAEKLIVLTGAASGLGLGMARRLSRQRVKLALVDSSGENLQRAQAELAGSAAQVEGHCVDVTDDDAIKALFALLDQRHGGVYGLVNNAGIHPKRPDGWAYSMEDTSTSVWEKVIRVNLTAPFVLCREVLPIMKRQKMGRIVNITSRGARMYLPKIGSAHYCASKAGLVGLTRALAGECGPYGITANCVAPGRISTPMSEVAGTTQHGAFSESCPAGRVGVPDEIAAAVEFLLSEAASFINGASIDVNGGAYMP